MLLRTVKAHHLFRLGPWLNHGSHCECHNQRVIAEIHPPGHLLTLGAPLGSTTPQADLHRSVAHRLDDTWQVVSARWAPNQW